ncbi:MAG TPA: hypothetical protein VLT16_01030 [Candidatus Limnocylindrales bacterium]|nr:hypothetical protein [Candidatus Limnocylindrales bacterium]
MRKHSASSRSLLYMSPVTHFFAGWLLAGATPLNRREKAAVSFAAVAPDIDGLGAVPELLTRHSRHPLPWFSQYHHSLHTLAFASLLTLAVFLLLRFPGKTFAAPSPGGHRYPGHPWTAGLLVFLSFHLHLFCDLIGSRGPDGYSWPIPYLKPFSNAVQLSWHGQWALNGWQNVVITCVLLLAILWTTWRTGSSPLELASARASHEVVTAIRRRFPARTSA